MPMIGTKSMWISKKDLVAIVGISLLTLLYFLGYRGTDNFVAIAIILSLISWIIWKIERAYRIDR
jgi:hypothetical protein